MPHGAEERLYIQVENAPFKAGGSLYIMPPAREKVRSTKTQGADELPKAGARNETLFFQLSYTWYGTVCEAS